MLLQLLELIRINIWKSKFAKTGEKNPSFIFINPMFVLLEKQHNLQSLFYGFEETAAYSA